MLYTPHAHVTYGISDKIWNCCILDTLLRSVVAFTQAMQILDAKITDSYANVRIMNAVTSSVYSHIIYMFTRVNIYICKNILYIHNDQYISHKTFNWVCKIPVIRNIEVNACFFVNFLQKINVKYYYEYVYIHVYIYIYIILQTIFYGKGMSKPFYLSDTVDRMLNYNTRLHLRTLTTFSNTI